MSEPIALSFYLRADARSKIAFLLQNAPQPANPMVESEIHLIQTLLDASTPLPLSIQAFWLNWNKNAIAFCLDSSSPFLAFCSKMIDTTPIIYDVRLMTDHEVASHYTGSTNHDYRTTISCTVQFFSSSIATSSPRGFIQVLLTDRKAEQKAQLEGRILPSIDYLKIAIAEAKAKRFHFISRQCKLIGPGMLEMHLNEKDSTKYARQIQTCQIDGKKLDILAHKEEKEVQYPATIQQWNKNQHVMILKVDPAEAIADDNLRALGAATRVRYDHTSDLDIQKRAFESLKSSRKQLHQLPIDLFLFGENEEVLEAIRPITKEERKQVAIFPYLRPDLNEEQREAIELALATPDFFMLQGPPGTGKTTFIAELCYQIAKRGGSVLLVSQAHFAVDNALSRLKPDPEILACRFGNIQRMHASGLDFVKDKAVQRWLHSLASEIQEELARLQVVPAIQHILSEGWDEIAHNYQIYEEWKEKSHQNQGRTPEEQQSEKSMKLYLQRVWSRLRPLLPTFSQYSPQEQDGAISFADMLALKTRWVQGEGDAWKVRTLQQRIEILQEWYDLLQHDPTRIEIPPAIWQLFLERANVVAATCAYSGSSAFFNQIVKARKKVFDYVIIDEISKVTANELLGPTLVGHKIILVGDHKQLPPLWREETQDNLQRTVEAYIEDTELIPSYVEKLKKSFFSLFFTERFDFLMAHGSERARMLTRQYRMHSQIMEGVNQFYNYKLVQGCSDDERAHMLDAHPWLPNPEAHLAWVDTSMHVDWIHEQKGNSKRNPDEARLIIQVLKEMLHDLEAKQPSLSIGIISVYRAQTKFLQQLLQMEQEKDEHFQSLLQRFKVDIGTVDAFQGQDLDIILLSLVLNGKYVDLSSFLSDPRRINVAISRARRLLLIFGSKYNYVDTPSPSQEFYQNIYALANKLEAAIPAESTRRTYTRYISLIYDTD